MATVTIDEFIRKTQARLEEAVPAIKIELFSGVIENTRVDTGRLKGNWQVTQDTQARGTLEREDKTGATVKREVENTVTVNGVEFLTNNLDYAAHWNERDGIIDRQLARLNQIIRGAIK